LRGTPVAPIREPVGTQPQTPLHVNTLEQVSPELVLVSPELAKPSLPLDQLTVKVTGSSPTFPSQSYDLNVAVCRPETPRSDQP
jgi:hypothetical protein